MITLIQASTSLAANRLPEYYGVYARYKSGELIQLKAIAPSLTQVVFPGTIESVLRSPRFHYVTTEPITTLDMNKVNAFIIYGDAKIENNTQIYYFGQLINKKAGFFENKGHGDETDSYLNIGYTCGPNDGMQYKKIKDGMYIYSFPVKEATDYKFCDLKTGKIAHTPELQADTPVDFFGWYYAGQFWTFKTK